MATVVIMPRQGQSVESCILTKWHKQVGDAVKVGDALFEYETDKSSFTEEATAEGVLLAAFAQEGDEVVCLDNVCVIGAAGEDISGISGGSAAEEAPAPAPAAAPVAAAPAAAPVAKEVKIPDGVTVVIMPRQGQSVESCILTKWDKQVGDAVKVGDALFEYETDKSSFTEEATAEGTLLAAFWAEGDEVVCLDNVCVIGPQGTDVSMLAPTAEEAAAPAAAPVAAAPVAAAVAPVVAAAPQEGFVAISPRARKAAEKAHVDYRFATGTGPKGRIVEKDIEALVKAGVGFTGAAMPFADGQKDGTGFGGRVSVEDLNKAPVAVAAPAAAAAPAAVEEAETWEEKLPGIRKVIAKSMHASLSTMAQLTLNTSFDATEIMAFRSKVKNNMEALGLANITLNDIILYAVSRVLPNHPALNAHFFDDKMVYFKNVQLGMAVDTPRGLMVPTIRNANKLTLNEIAVESKKMAKDAQAGSINPDLLTGGSFTVTNLGSMGIESFTPVINPPQTGILGVDTVVQRPKMVNGEMKLYPAMGLSLTFDHRAIDGAPAAKFLKELAATLENFSILLAK